MGPPWAGLGQSEWAIEGRLPRNHRLLGFLKRFGRQKTHEGKATFYKRGDPLLTPLRARGSGQEEECTDVERGKETRTQRSFAEKELRAQVAGFLGLSHPSRAICDERATVSVRFGPSATRMRRAAAARTVNSDLGRRAQPATRPAWGLRSPARRTTSLPAPPLRPANALPAARRKQDGVFDCVHSTTPTWPRPPAGLTFAEQRQQKQPPQPRRRLRHRPCAPGPRQEDGGSDRGCRRRGVVLSRAAPSRPGRGGRGGRGGHCGRGASERDTRALSAAWAGL